MSLAVTHPARMTGVYRVDVPEAYGNVLRSPSPRQHKDYGARVWRTGSLGHTIRRRDAHPCPEWSEVLKGY